MIVSRNGKNHRLPDFMVIGAARSGTTTLYRHLQSHSDIFIPNHCKEPAFFNFGGKKPYLTDAQLTQKIVWRPEDYYDLFASAKPSQLLGDCSTSYLYQPEVVIENIKAWYGKEFKKIKIIAILRDPVNRAFSHHSHLIRHGHETLAFSDAIEATTIACRKKERWGYDYLEHGNYAKQIEAFQKAFPEMKTVLFSDLKSAQNLMDGIFSFLEVDSITVNEEVKANPSGKPQKKSVLKMLTRNPVLRSLARLLPKEKKMALLNTRDKLLHRVLEKDTLEEKDLNKLRTYYKNDVLRLENLIHRDLSNWTE